MRQSITELEKHENIFFKQFLFFSVSYHGTVLCLATQTCLTLCDPMDCSLPGSSVHGILQARILEWAAMPFSRVLCYIFSSIHLPSFFCRLASLLTICIIYYPNLQLTLSYIQIRSDQIRSVAQSCPTLCDPMNCSTPGLPVHHQLPEFTQTHVHRVSDAIQPSHPPSSPSLAPNPSQHQSLFQ